MKFVKGMLIGSIVSAGIVIAYSYGFRLIDFYESMRLKGV